MSFHWNYIRGMPKKIFHVQGQVSFYITFQGHLYIALGNYVVWLLIVQEQGHLI